MRADNHIWLSELECRGESGGQTLLDFQTAGMKKPALSRMIGGPIEKFEEAPIFPGEVMIAVPVKTTEARSKKFQRIDRLGTGVFLNQKSLVNGFGGFLVALTGGGVKKGDHQQTSLRVGTGLFCILGRTV